MLDHDGGQGEVTPEHTEEDAKMDRWSREKANRGRQRRDRRGRREFSEEEEPPESLDDENEEAMSEEKKTSKKSWIEWVQRATHIAEHHLEKLRISDWVTKSRILGGARC